MNIFNNLPTLVKKGLLKDELDSYLAMEVEEFQTNEDMIKWWHDHWSTYLHLSRMVLDYLTIPGKHNIIDFVLPEFIILY